MATANGAVMTGHIIDKWKTISTAKRSGPQQGIEFVVFVLRAHLAEPVCYPKAGFRTSKRAYLFCQSLSNEKKENG